MNKQIKKQERVILEIIEKYGSIIDLKKSPFIIGEIIRKFGNVFEPDPTDPKTGGTPGSHGPGTSGIPDHKIDWIINELKILSKSVKKIEVRINK